MREQRQLWIWRVKAEVRAGNLPSAAILTAEALLACLGPEGELYPSHATIAAKAGVGLRTVPRHLRRLEQLRLVAQHRRLRRMPWPEAGRGATRAVQDTNAYELLFAPGPVTPAARRRRRTPQVLPQRTDCHGGGGDTLSGKRSVPTMDAVDARKALERVRIARTASLAAAWMAQREGKGPREARR